jgi:hypothetical protein
MNHALSEEDLEFQQSFELFKVAPASFDHAAHVRLAYIYLCQHPVDDAAAHMKGALLAFLEHLGIGNSKFHETVTRAWILAVRHFMARSPDTASSQAFIAANPRLLDTRLMLRHYSEDLLFSQDARTSIVHPDLAAIPAHA